MSSCHEDANAGVMEHFADRLAIAIAPIKRRMTGGTHRGRARCRAVNRRRNNVRYSQLMQLDGDVNRQRIYCSVFVILSRSESALIL